MVIYDNCRLRYTPLTGRRSTPGEVPDYSPLNTLPKVRPVHTPVAVLVVVGTVVVVVVVAVVQVVGVQPVTI